MSLCSSTTPFETDHLKVGLSWISMIAMSCEGHIINKLLSKTSTGCLCDYLRHLTLWGLFGCILKDLKEQKHNLLWL